MKRISIGRRLVLAMPIFLALSWFHMKVYAHQEEEYPSKVLVEESQQGSEAFDNWEQLTVLGYGGIFDLSYSPDGTRLAVAGYEAGFIEIRETKSWRPLVQMNEPSARSVAWSPDGHRLASGSHIGTIKIWDGHTGRLLNTLSGHTHWVTSVGWSANGRKLASGSTDQSVKIWDGETGKLIRTIMETDQVISISWSPDNIRVATGCADRTVKIWNSETGELVRSLSAHANPVLWVSWSPDGRKLASSAAYRSARIWDAETGKLLLDLQHDHTEGFPVNAVAWSPDSRQVATAVGYFAPAIWIWEAETGKLTMTISIHRHPDAAYVQAYRVSWYPDGSQIAVAFSGGKFRIWNARTGELLAAPVVHTTSNYLVRWSPDNHRLVAPGYDFELAGTIEIVNLETQDIIQIPASNRLPLSAVDWSADGTRIASSSDDRLLKIWDVETEELMVTVEETAAVSSLRFSPDGSQIALGLWDGSMGEIKVRDADTGDMLQTIPTRAVGSIRWSPDGTKFASIGTILEDGSRTGLIEIHEAETGKLVRTIREDRNLLLGPLDWSPDGTKFATGVNQYQGVGRWIKIWEVESGKSLRRFEIEGGGYTQSFGLRIADI